MYVGVCDRLLVYRVGVLSYSHNYVSFDSFLRSFLLSSGGLFRSDILYGGLD